jgi:hypothetical protein
MVEMVDKEPTLSEKACFVIDCLLTEGIAQDLEFQIAVHDNYKLSVEQIKEINETLGLVYELAHVGNNPSCIKVHSDWVKHLNELYDKFKGEK